jgi:hypothetical protein
MAKRVDDEAEFIMADEDGNPTSDRSKAVMAERTKTLPGGIEEHTIMRKKGRGGGRSPVDPVTGKIRPEALREN